MIYRCSNGHESDNPGFCMKEYKPGISCCLFPRLVSDDTITEKERRIASHSYALACFEDILTNGVTIDEGHLNWRFSGWASPEYAMVFDALIAMIDEDK